MMLHFCLTISMMIFFFFLVSCASVSVSFLNIAPSSYNCIFLPQGLCTGCLLSQSHQSLYSSPVNSPSSFNLQRFSLTSTTLTPAKPCHLNWISVFLFHTLRLILSHRFLITMCSYSFLSVGLSKVCLHSWSCLLLHCQHRT